jgi:hypothetical protein
MCSFREGSCERRSITAERTDNGVSEPIRLPLKDIVMRRSAVLTVTFAAAIAAATACGSGSGNPTAAASSSPTAPDGVCAAATADALMEALTSSPDFYTRAGSPTGIRSVQCSAPFALGWTEGSVQPPGVLFRRDDSRWTVLDLGTAINCGQYGVTAEDDFEGCRV